MSGNGGGLRYEFPLPVIGGVFDNCDFDATVDEAVAAGLDETMRLETLSRNGVAFKVHYFAGEVATQDAYNKINSMPQVFSFGPDPKNSVKA